MNDKTRRYDGKNVVVRYDVKRCIHAEVCVKDLPSVFQRDRRPWVDPDAAPGDRVADVVTRCPTGALHFKRKDGSAGEPVPQQNAATLEVDGPVYLRGDVKIVGGDGSLVLGDTRIALCRCGASENKPFCDGRHSDVGFSHQGEVAEPKPRPDAYAPGGPLTVTPLTNGPLILKGTLEVRSADERTSSFHDAQAALCRCGASQKKPFCDGSHKKIGFTAE